ncbi:MAG TPA: twin-arginine translocase subunit TatC [Planctomycetota bacterium]|nr:twin-arginine translocase subunit TatC [Planctomycetota bacterium]
MRKRGLSMAEGIGEDDAATDDASDGRMHSQEHLWELRWRMAIVLVCWVAGTVVAAVLLEGNWLGRLLAAPAYGLAMAYPVLWYQLWAFIVPGLRRSERRRVCLPGLVLPPLVVLAIAWVCGPLEQRWPAWLMAPAGAEDAALVAKGVLIGLMGAAAIGATYLPVTKAPFVLTRLAPALVILACLASPAVIWAGLLGLLEILTIVFAFLARGARLESWLPPAKRLQQADESLRQAGTSLELYFRQWKSFPAGPDLEEALEPFGEAAQPGLADKSGIPGGRVDRVHFTVTSPAVVRLGGSFVLDVWAHLEAQRAEVVRRAREAEAGAEIRARSEGPALVAAGSVLTVHVTVSGLGVEEPQSTILWEGEIGSAGFVVAVPPDAEAGTHIGVATIYLHGLRLARVHFSVEVGAEASAAVEALATREERTRKAFASYASADREAMLARVQGMQKAAPDLEVFVDVNSLRSGQTWEEELWRVIPENDVFYLFWSQHARDSVWVDKEWRCALKARGLDFIDPVPLVSPEAVPPPAELASKHFNDWVLAYMRGRGAG